MLKLVLASTIAVLFSDIIPVIKDYLVGKIDPESKNQDKLTAYLTFHDIPQLGELNDLNVLKGK